MTGIDMCSDMRTAVAVVAVVAVVAGVAEASCCTTHKPIGSGKRKRPKELFWQIGRDRLATLG